MYLARVLQGLDVRGWLRASVSLAFRELGPGSRGPFFFVLCFFRGEGKGLGLRVQGLVGLKA